MQTVYVNPIFRIQNDTGVECDVTITSEAGIAVDGAMPSEDLQAMILGKTKALIQIVIKPNINTTMVREISKERPH